MEPQRRPRTFTPLLTALWAGLTWALLYGVIDNIPLLAQGDILSHVRVRFQAMAYVHVAYAAAAVVLMGAVGLVLTAVLAVVRRPAGRPLLLGLSIGLLAGATSAGLWLEHYRILDLPDSNPNKLVSIGYTLLVAAAAAVVAGWLTYHAARWWVEGPEPRRPFWRGLVRWGPPLVTLTVALLLAAVGLYRNVIRPALPGPTTGQVATPERPNVVLITIDSLRADHLGAYGYDPAISPNIDALARRGVRFDQAIAQSSWTLPSVASMVTSMYPTELDIYAWRDLKMQSHLDPMRTTMAESLQAAGYRTQGYATNAWITHENGFDQGFDQFNCFRTAEAFDHDMLLQHPLLKLSSRSPFLYKLGWRGYYLLFDRRLLTGNDGLAVSLYALSFLQEHQDERFFLWLYYLEPHTSYAPSAAFPSAPTDVSEEHYSWLSSLDYWSFVASSEDMLVPEDTPVLTSLYDGEIRDVDRWVGGVLDELARLGLNDRTLIILHSDHGEEFADHGGFVHGITFYDEVVRVPLLVAGPGISPGQVAAPVQLLDLMPTVLETAGATLPPEAHGRSLWPLLRGGALEEVPIYAEMRHSSLQEKKMIRYQGWKLIYALDSGEMELYNLAADPREQVNLALQERERGEEYLRLLRRWLAQAVETEQALPRSVAPAGVDEHVREMLREGGY